jgi:hypothetical protein
METNEIKLAWTEICYLLSESIKQDINEKDFENQVLRTIEKLGWQEYAGEIERQPILQLGRKTNIRPDLVIYGSHKKALIVIEVKRPAEDMSKDDVIGQLKSYMRQMKADFGLIIGKGIHMYYDGYLNPQQEPLLLDKIPFERETKKGQKFVEIFNREDFIEKRYDSHLNNLIDQFDRTRNIKKLKDTLLTESNKKKIYQFLKNEYADFGSDIITEALGNLRVELSFDEDEKTKITSKLPEITGPKEHTVRYNTMETIKNAKGGITHKELKEATGFTDKQLNNVLHKLKKKGMIESPKRAFFIAK